MQMKRTRSCTNETWDYCAIAKVRALNCKWQSRNLIFSVPNFSLLLSPRIEVDRSSRIFFSLICVREGKSWKNCFQQKLFTKIQLKLLRILLRVSIGSSVWKLKTVKIDKLILKTFYFDRSQASLIFLWWIFYQTNLTLTVNCIEEKENCFPLNSFFKCRSFANSYSSLCNMSVCGFCKYLRSLIRRCFI